jgi:hypothetical protein
MAFLNLGRRYTHGILSTIVMAATAIFIITSSEQVKAGPPALRTTDFGKPTVDNVFKSHSCKSDPNHYSCTFVAKDESTLKITIDAYASPYWDAHKGDANARGSHIGVTLGNESHRDFAADFLDEVNLEQKPTRVYGARVEFSPAAAAMESYVRHGAYTGIRHGAKEVKHDLLDMARAGLDKVYQPGNPIFGDQTPDEIAMAKNDQLNKTTAQIKSLVARGAAHKRGVVDDRLPHVRNEILAQSVFLYYGIRTTDGRSGFLVMAGKAGRHIGPGDIDWITGLTDIERAGSFPLVTRNNTLFSTGIVSFTFLHRFQDGKRAEITLFAAHDRGPVTNILDMIATQLTVPNERYRDRYRDLWKIDSGGAKIVVVNGPARLYALVADYAGRFSASTGGTVKINPETSIVFDYTHSDSPDRIRNGMLLGIIREIHPALTVSLTDEQVWGAPLNAEVAGKRQTFNRFLFGVHLALYEGRFSMFDYPVMVNAGLNGAVGYRFCQRDDACESDVEGMIGPIFNGSFN